MENKWVEVKGLKKPIEKKQCEGQNCLNKFDVLWPDQRRCDRCKKEDRAYHDTNSPF